MCYCSALLYAVPGHKVTHLQQCFYLKLHGIRHHDICMYVIPVVPVCGMVCAWVVLRCVCVVQQVVRFTQKIHRRARVHIIWCGTHSYLYPADSMRRVHVAVCRTWCVLQLASLFIIVFVFFLFFWH